MEVCPKCGYKEVFTLPFSDNDNAICQTCALWKCAGVLGLYCDTHHEHSMKVTDECIYFIQR